MEATEMQYPKHPELSGHAGHVGHASWGRFPTREELFGKEVETGIGRQLNLGAISDRIERHLAEVLRSAGVGNQEDGASPRTVSAAASRGVTQQAPSWVETQELIRREMVAMVTAIARPRVDHRTLTDTERNRFNEALQEAHKDSSYGVLAAVHEDMSHRMHMTSRTDYVGGQRFLPWHRLYLVKMENLLRSKRWGVTIPYWSYSVDQERPDWVWKPGDVTRDTPGNGSKLPSQATVDNLIHDKGQFTAGWSYTAFSNTLELEAHNNVHNWCNGTITDPKTATRDPIFWLLHANVDRIWDLWQANHFVGPNLSNVDATMDPWPQTAADVNRVVNLGYLYQ